MDNQGRCIFESLSEIEINRFLKRSVEALVATDRYRWTTEENMGKKKLDEIIAMFSDTGGFGDPEARRNAELRLQLLLAQQQSKTANRLNLLTFLLVVVGLLNAAVLAFQVWGK